LRVASVLSIRAEQEDEKLDSIARLDW